MYCSQCGKEISEKEKGCPYCGHMLGEHEFGYEAGEKEMEHQVISNPAGTLIKRVSFWKFLFFSMITLGIYMIYVLYRFAKDMNILCKGDGKDSPNYFIVILLNIITCGVYGCYWSYMQAERLYEAGKGYGVTINDKGSTVVLWQTVGCFLFGLGPFIALYKLFKNRNLIVEKYNGGVRNPELNRTEPIKMGVKAKIVCGIGVFFFVGSILLIVILLNTIFGNSNLRYTNDDILNEDLFSDEVGLDEYSKDIDDELYVNLVKEGSPEAYPDITYGQAFEAFFSSTMWTYFESTDSRQIVEFSGECTYKATDVRANLLFVLDVESNTFEASSLNFNGVPQNEDLVNQLLLTVFEDYKRNNSTFAQESQEMSETQVKTETEYVSSSTSDNAKQIIDYYEVYDGIVTDTKAVYGENSQYALYDIDKDGIKELITSQGENNADWTNNVYTVNNGEVTMLGTFYRPVLMYEAEEGIGFYTVYGMQGYQEIVRITKSGFDIYEETIMTGEIAADEEYYSNDNEIVKVPISNEDYLKEQ